MIDERLPFFFEELEPGKILLTDLAGRYGYVDGRDKLENAINSLATSPSIASDNPEARANVALLASAVSHRIKSNLIGNKIFMVVPTLRCDHNCTYCQVSRVNQEAVGYDLDIELIPKIIKSIRSNGSFPYQIEFQGGEPLLRFDFLQSFYDQMEAEVSGNSYVIATSLSLLTDEIVDWAKDRSVQFSVSIDGIATVHNYSRRNLIGSSHDLALSGIQKIIAELGHGKIGLVTTVTRGLFNSYKEFAELVSSIGVSELFVRQLSPYGFAKKKYNEHYTIDEYFLFYRKFIKHLIENYNHLGLVEATFKIHIQKIMDPQFNSYIDLKSPTGYLLNALVYDYSGKVFGSDEARMIYKSEGIEELVLQDLNTDLPIDLTSSQTIISNSFISETPGCDQCAYSPFCGSDPMYHLATQGDFVGNKALSDFCRLQKRLFSFAFTLLDDEEAKNTLNGWVNG
jgi:His-Xaa-Ser system radical SAM maturase HxsB